jgi:hypothetical protein
MVVRVYAIDSAAAPLQRQQRRYDGVAPLILHGQGNLSSHDNDLKGLSEISGI